MFVEEEENFNRIDEEDYDVKTKTRDLSMFEYLHVLQIEFVVAELRKKIYPSKKDKNYYSRVMIFKKEKIEDIATRNKLPTIFDDEAMKEKVYLEVYNREGGFPNFHYKDNGKTNPKTGRKEIDEQMENDFYNYYLSDTEIKVIMEDNQIAIGTIKDVDEENDICRVKLRHDNEIKIVTLNRVTRIL